MTISKSCSVSGFLNFQCWKSNHKHNQIMQWILARYFLKRKIWNREYEGTCWPLCSIGIWHCHWKIQSSIVPLWRPKQTHILTNCYKQSRLNWVLSKSSDCILCKGLLVFWALSLAQRLPATPLELMYRCLHNLSPINQNGSKFLKQCVLLWNTWLWTKARNQVILQIKLVWVRIQVGFCDKWN